MTFGIFVTTFFASLLIELLSEITDFMEEVDQLPDPE